jgi:hypothetical protein
MLAGLVRLELEILSAELQGVRMAGQPELLQSSTVGWVDFGLIFKFSTKVPVPLRFITYLPKLPKIATTKIFNLVTTPRYAAPYIRVQKFFFTKWTSWVSKDPGFYVDFKNINLSK